MSYVADVETLALKGEDVSGTEVKLLNSSKVKYYWCKSDTQKMEMEVTSLLEDGSETDINRERAPGRFSFPNQDPGFMIVNPAAERVSFVDFSRVTSIRLPGCMRS